MQLLKTSLDICKIDKVNKRNTLTKPTINQATINKKIRQHKNYN